MQKLPPEPLTIAVVDYGAGNLRSVRRALEAVGHEPVVTSDPRALECAHGLVLPGVGSANDAMKALHRLGLVQFLRDYAASGRPFLGVCIGLQLLFDWSEEGGGGECLRIIPGTVRRIRVEEASIKVPHMGWNNVRFKYEHPLLAGVPNDSHFYFVHSYYADPLDRTVVIGETSHGVDIAAIVAQDNVAAVQFHPEKSAELGLRLYQNFANQVASHQSQPLGRRRQPLIES